MLSIYRTKTVHGLKLSIFESPGHSGVVEVCCEWLELCCFAVDMKFGLYLESHATSAQ